MRIAVNCKQHQAYQYGAFREAFTHTESYYGYRRWSVDASLRIAMCGGFGSLDRDAHFTRLNAALDVSRWHFQRSSYTYRKLFWEAPVVRRCILGNRRVGGLLMRIGYANFTQLNVRLNLSIWHVPRSFYTCRKLFWPTPVAGRCILKVRRVWRLWHCGWRCVESSNRPINKALSATLLDIWIGIYASAGDRTILP
jgi:hypothetical protein